MRDTQPSLNGKSALITGAAKRIGAYVASALHAAGMNIVLHYRDSRSEAQALAAKLNSERRDSVILVRTDLLNSDAVLELVETATSAWNGLDVLINNASAFYPTPVGEIGEAQWDELMGANLKAPLFLSQAAAPWLKSSQRCIINITDIHADQPLKGYTVYCLAKAGLVMLTKSLARELAPDVRVNGIAPGAILWPEVAAYAPVHQAIIDRTMLKREGKPRDIAAAALFLIRDANYVTGHIIPVDGGRTLSG